MKTKFKLPSGTTGFYNEKNEWVCTGAQMGRRDVLPTSTHPKLRLRKVPFIDGCYDRWGAYWGAPANLFCAWDDEGTMLFRRGLHRQAVKSAIQAEYPHATFYR